MSFHKCWRVVWCVLAIGLLSVCALAQGGSDTKEWVQLFNGKNLDGWHPKITGYELDDNYGNTFRVVDGMLTVSYDQYEEFGTRFGHIFHEGTFSRYVIAVEYRFVGEQVAGGPGWALRNSGIMIHGQPARTMTKDQNFPISIEVQLLGGSGSGERSTANLCTPGTNVVMDGKLITKHCLSSSSKTYHGEQWVRVEVEVLGSGSVKHIVDGETVIAYEKSQIGGGNVANHDKSIEKEGMLLEEGSISLQSESHPIQFRKVELLNLVGCMDKKAHNYKSYFVKADPAQCRY
ncbi:MAG: DUF1080 domain-containing protein [bacterium]|nr:DUF1080 domain-containing protein [bacterium]